MTDLVDRLYHAVVAAQTADPAESRTARLLRSGRGKMAKKLAEEAVEVVIDAMNGQREAVVRESADLSTISSCSGSSAGIDPKEVWDEMSRRERLFGIAEKLPEACTRCCRDARAARSSRWRDPRRARKRR